MDEAQFEAFVTEVQAALPADSTDAGMPFNELVASRFRCLYTDPPVGAASLAAGRTVGGLELRRVLFAPDTAAGDASVYVAVLAPLPKGMPSTNPRARLQSDALILLQLRHAQSPPFLAALVRSGLLQVLAFIIGEAADTPALVFRRAQALDLLHRVTAEPTFRWFETPGDVAASLPESASRGQRRRAYDSAAALHSCMLALAPPHPFVPALLSLRSAEEAGISHGALQLVAFWLSWARRCHSKDGVLHLSGAVLRALREWAGLPADATPPPLPGPAPAPEDAAEAEAGAGEERPGGARRGGEGESKASEEHVGEGVAAEAADGGVVEDSEVEGEEALARRLWEDFARFDTAEAVAATEAAAGGETAALGGLAAAEGASATAATAAPPMPRAAAWRGAGEDGSGVIRVPKWQVSAADCKAKGNAAYASGKNMAAAAWYRAAVSVLDTGLGEGVALPEQEELLCDSLSNLAAALLRAGEGGGDPSAEPAAVEVRGDAEMPAGEAGGVWGAALAAASSLPAPGAWQDLLALAEEACSRVLRVSGEHAKALGRRARVRRALGGRERLSGGQADALAALAVLQGAPPAAGSVGTAASRSNSKGSAARRRSQVAELRALVAQLRKELEDIELAEMAEFLDGKARRIFELMAPADVRPAAPAIDAASSLRASGAAPVAKPSVGIRAQLEVVAGPVAGMDDVIAEHASKSGRRGLQAEAAVLGGSLRVSEARKGQGSKAGKKKQKNQGKASSLTNALLRASATAADLGFE